MEREKHNLPDYIKPWLQKLASARLDALPPDRYDLGTLTCVEAGVMAPLVGTIGSLQAMEAIKLLTGYGTPASGKIVMYDAMTCQFREMKLMRHPQCEVCGTR